MNAMQIIGLILTILAVLFFAGTIVEGILAIDNQAAYDEQAGTPILGPIWELTDEAEEARSIYETQYTFAGVCCSLFAIFLIIGIVLLIVGGITSKKEKRLQSQYSAYHTMQQPHQMSFQPAGEYPVRPVSKRPVPSPPPPPVSPSIPPCLSCGRPTILVKEYNRHWCEACQKYN